ncbi:MAG: hypothetical protein K2X57_08325 [Xanthobacteraceae bacterium]|nr:hypothetical protein [Xanthobacteraceae bacterium]
MSLASASVAGASIIAGKTPSDLIDPLLHRVKSGMKAFVVKVKYIPNHYKPEKPVVML